MKKKNKNNLDKSFYSLFFIMFDFIFYYLLTLNIIYKRNKLFDLIIINF